MFHKWISELAILNDAIEHEMLGDIFHVSLVDLSIMIGKVADSIWKERWKSVGL
jgi:hypothetical protein